MSREAHVRFCERLGVRFPRSTRHSLKHGNERWGINQLDCRKTSKYPPGHVIVNPARRRLEQALFITRDREGTLRRQLAHLKGGSPRRNALKIELAENLAMQKKLEAERKDTPKHAFLKDTELADKLVYIDTTYKALLDTIRIACINAESDLADVLRESLARPKEAKKVLANLFKATGSIRNTDHSVIVTLDMVGTDDERDAVERLLQNVNQRNLSLPGDPLARPLRFQF